MDTYLQICKKAKEQNLDLNGLSILIPYEENKFFVNGEPCFGRIFDNGLVCALREIDFPDSEDGHIKEPFFYMIEDKYETWIEKGVMLCKTEFYTIK